MPDIKFTKSQQTAIDEIARDVSVSAGAGSGKTEVLVTRFCRIVESGAAKVDEVLTITFTEKAAREMKERIVKRFEEKGLEEERRAVESAYIGTIHSFATRVLKENSFEAGLDPRFSVLDEPAAASISRRLLETIIESGCRQADPDILMLMEAMGPGQIFDAVTGAHARLCSLGLRAGDVKIMQPSDVNSIAIRLLTAMDEVLGFTGRSTPSVEEKLSRIREEMPQVRDIIHRCVDCDHDFDWEAYAETGKYDKLFPKTVTTELKPLMTDVRTILEEFRPALLDRPAYQTAIALLSLIKTFQKSYTAEKRRSGHLDFDDLLLITRDLFIQNGKPTAAAESYRNKFKYITMDEFQDTNPLQKQIVDAIRTPERFFTVGDVKQSIYGFNNSDVRVFVNHHDSIAEEGRISFRENFRSKPTILGFVNWLFSQMFEEDEDVTFEELVAGRTLPDAGDPDIELLLVPADGLSPVKRLTEAYAIANRIRSICGMDGEKPLEIQTKDGSTRPVGFADIVMLFKSTTSIATYERALHQAGIPYYVVSGRGYFQTREVKDVLSLLKIVENPLDDVSMAAVLRSPMVRLSDDGLYWLSRDHSPQDDIEEDNEGFPTRNRNIGKLYEAISSEKALGRLSDKDAEKIRRFNSLLTRLHSDRAEGRITDIIDQALRETGYEPAVLAMSNGKRKYANIRKLCEIAQRFQATGLFGLAEFIRYIRELETIADREAEAPTETEGSGVVRLMTIHKAKGLEAPVVVVADTSGPRPNIVPSVLIDRSGALSCKVRDPYTDQTQTPACFKKTWDSFRAEEFRELKRLFYVATTRARDLLVLSGSTNLGGKPKDTYLECSTWMAALEKAFGLDQSITESTVIHPDGGEPVTVRLENSIDLNGRVSHKTTLLDAHRGKLEQGLPITASASPAQTKKTVTALMPIVSSGPSEVYSVSRLLDYDDCPRRYRLKYILKLDEEENEVNDGSFLLNLDGGEPDAAVVGSRVHDVLRAVRFGPDFRKDVETLAGECEPELRKTIIDSCMKLERHPVYEEICRSESVFREVPFVVKLGGVQLAGRIDLLYKDRNGWTVVDYKTGGNDLEHRYKLQVGVYAAAVRKLLGEMPANIRLVALGRGKSHSESPAETDLVEVENNIKDTANSVQRAMFVSKLSARCEWCGYRSRHCANSGS